MGSSQKKFNKTSPAMNAVSRADQMTQNVMSGRQKTAAQLSFERNLADARRSQIAVAKSGFGGSMFGRVRSLEDAQSKLAAESSLARDVLKQNEVDRLKQVQAGFADAGAGAYANQMRDNAAIMGAAVAGGSQLLSSFAPGSKKKDEDK